MENIIVSCFYAISLIQRQMEEEDLDFSSRSQTQQRRIATFAASTCKQSKP
jgi:hypothetical protein